MSSVWNRESHGRQIGLLFTVNFEASRVYLISCKTVLEDDNNSSYYSVIFQPTKNPRWRVKLATSFLGVYLPISWSIYSRLNPVMKAEYDEPKANAALAIHGALRAISRLAYHCHIILFLCLLTCEFATWVSRYRYFIALVLNRLIGVYWCQSEDLSIRVIERSPHFVQCAHINQTYISSELFKMSIV